MTQPRKAQRNRWANEIVSHLEDFPRQYAALESAMVAFGEDFSLDRFKAAYQSADMEAYNRVQAVERALGRVQNYVAVLAARGTQLAGLEPIGKSSGPDAQRAFESMREAKVMGAELTRKLIRAQKARTAIEHSYVSRPAGEVHRAAELVHEVANQFMVRYRPWIEEFLRP